MSAAAAAERQAPAPCCSAGEIAARKEKAEREESAAGRGCARSARGRPAAAGTQTSETLGRDEERSGDTGRAVAIFVVALLALGRARAWRRRSVAAATRSPADADRRCRRTAAPGAGALAGLANCSEQFGRLPPCSSPTTSSAA